MIKEKTGVPVAVLTNIDVSELKPGMKVVTVQGNQILNVTDYPFDDGIDYAIPCSDGVLYSPLCLY